MTPREAWLVTTATLRVLRNSARLDDIHLVGEITARRAFTRLVDPIRRRDPTLFEERPIIAPDLRALADLPADTLGGAFARHIAEHGLELYAGTVREEFNPDPDVRYLIHRYRQVHDLWHVLLGLGTRGHEEVLVHAFSLGLLGLPNSGMIVFFGTIKHILLEGRFGVLRRQLWAAYDAGRRCAPLMAVRWEQHWREPVGELRARYGVGFAEMSAAVA